MYISPDQDQKIRYTLRDCGQEAYKLAAEPFEVSEKAPDDYVTSIDRYLDRQLSAAFSALFPEDGRITEENSASRAAYRANYQRLWCIDPLDGTEEFIRGKLHYASMVGLLLEGEPVAGWLTPRLLTKCILAAKIGDCSKVWEPKRRSRSPCANPLPDSRKL